MLLCNETVTLIHCNKAPDGETYTCTVIVGASWFGKTQITYQQGGVVGGKVVKVRVPEENMPDGVLPKAGDFMARGVVASVARLQDLAETEHFKVTSVGDNRRGRLRHWLIGGSDSTGAMRG